MTSSPFSAFGKELSFGESLEKGNWPLLVVQVSNGVTGARVERERRIDEGLETYRDELKTSTKREVFGGRF